MKASITLTAHERVSESVLVFSLVEVGVALLNKL